MRWFKKGKGNGGILMEGRIGPLVWFGSPEREAKEGKVDLAREGKRKYG